MGLRDFCHCPYMVYILDDRAPGSVPPSFLKDLQRFDVHNIQIVRHLSDLRLLDSEHAPDVSYLVSSAATGKAGLVQELEKMPLKSLEGILLFCGPHEDLYAKWAFQHKGVLFVSHNLRELRRAVVWLLAGGSFAANGDAIPPGRRFCDVASELSTRNFQGRRENRSIALTSQASLNTRALASLKEQDETLLRPVLPIPCAATDMVSSETETSFLEEFHDHLVAVPPVNSTNDMLFLNSAVTKNPSHRSSTETTASFTSSSVEGAPSGIESSPPKGDRLADIAHLVALFEALRIP